jgi:hypothetical protein
MGDCWFCKVIDSNRIPIGGRKEQVADKLTGPDHKNNNYLVISNEFPSIPLQEVDILVLAVIKKFGVLSVAKFTAVVGLVWGFLMGLMVLLMGSLIPADLTGTGMMGGGAGMIAGVVGFVVMIIVGGVGGFIGGAIMAVIYNIVLHVIGGIEMHLEYKT